MSGPAKTVLTVLVFFTLSRPAPARDLQRNFSSGGLRVNNKCPAWHRCSV